MKMVKTWLLWLLLLAIPLQGFAAASMLLCSGAPVGHSAAVQHEGAKTGHCAGVTIKKCSNCAACSVGAAIAPPAPLAMGASPADAAPAPATSPFATSHVDQGLERPPHARACQ